MSDGKLTPHYETHCAICSEPALGLGRSVRSAQSELLRSGWAKIRSLWHCPKCAATAMYAHLSSGVGRGG